MTWDFPVELLSEHSYVLLPVALMKLSLSLPKCLCLGITSMPQQQAGPIVKLSHLSESWLSWLLPTFWCLLFPSGARQENESVPGDSDPHYHFVWGCYELVREPCFYFLKPLILLVLYVCDSLCLSLSSSLLIEKFGLESRDVNYRILTPSMASIHNVQQDVLNLQILKMFLGYQNHPKSRTTGEGYLAVQSLQDFHSRHCSVPGTRGRHVFV
jgi:hypothetical protein